MFGGMAAKLGGNRFSDGAIPDGLNESMMPQFISQPTIFDGLVQEYEYNTAFDEYTPNNKLTDREGNIYTNLGEYRADTGQVFIRRADDNSIVYTQNITGPDGTPNWRINPVTPNATNIIATNIFTGVTAKLTQTYGDLYNSQHPDDSIVQTGSDTFISVHTGQALSTNYVNKNRNKINLDAGINIFDNIKAANKYQDKSKADSIREENVNKNLNRLNSKEPNKDPGKGTGIGVGLASGLYKEKEEIKHVYRSLKELKNLPKGIVSKKITEVRVNNSEILDKLSNQFGGIWKKVYNKGTDINGNPVEVHYFESSEGLIFNPKLIERFGDRVRKVLNLK